MLTIKHRSNKENLADNAMQGRFKLLLYLICEYRLLVNPIPMH